MGRGASKASGSSKGGGGGSTKEIKGDVTFSEIYNASKNHVTFDKMNTILPDGYIPETGKKGEIGSLLEKYNIKEFVGSMYRDRSGANDLKRMQSLGFEVQARYLGEPQGNIPPKDYYFFKKKR